MNFKIAFQAIFFIVFNVFSGIFQRYNFVAFNRRVDQSKAERSHRGNDVVDIF